MALPVTETSQEVGFRKDFFFMWHHKRIHVEEILLVSFLL